MMKPWAEDSEADVRQKSRNSKLLFEIHQNYEEIKITKTRIMCTSILFLAGIQTLFVSPSDAVRE